MTAPGAPLRCLSPQRLAELRDSTVSHYERNAASFWQGTKDHDVSQNVNALLRQLGSAEPLDIGCGPGRDLATFRALGHEAVGVDAAPTFVRMAREHAGCEVWQQDLLALDLPPRRFDGVFANAVLFHVPSQELPRVLTELHAALDERGVLFSSNPRGGDVEHLNGARYGCFLQPDTWCDYVRSAGGEGRRRSLFAAFLASNSRCFLVLIPFGMRTSDYRPDGQPREHQPWFASVWRKLT